MFKNLFAKFRAWVRIKVGLKFIRCSTPNDILVIKRYGTQKEWEYTLENVAEIVCSCGHYHSILFAESEFQNG